MIDNEIRPGNRFGKELWSCWFPFEPTVAAFEYGPPSRAVSLDERGFWKFSVLNADGVFAGMQRYLYAVKRLLFKWLNRQGGRRRMNWEKFALMERGFRIAKVSFMMFLLLASVTMRIVRECPSGPDFGPDSA